MSTWDFSEAIKNIVAAITIVKQKKGKSSSKELVLRRRLPAPPAAKKKVISVDITCFARTAIPLYHHRMQEGVMARSCSSIYFIRSISKPGGVQKGAGVTPLLRGRRRDWFRRALNQSCEPFLVRLEVGLFHLDRAGIIGQHVEELPSEGPYPLVASGGSHQIDPL
jgi:hypothetical protein